MRVRTGPPAAGRETVASLDTYADAQRAVDRLADEKYPVADVEVVGSDLRLVEDVTGRRTWARSAVSGLIGGAWFGALAGLFLALFTVTPAGFFIMVLWGLLIGAAAGLIFGLVAFAVTRGPRDFTSASALVAARYDVTVPATNTDRAREILGGQPSRGGEQRQG